MRFLAILTLAISVLSAEPLAWENLTDEQKANAVKIYEAAKKDDLAQTMLAIAWQESRLGKIAINLEDKASCGIHHIHIKTFLWQNGIKNTITNRNKHCVELIKDVELSTRNAIKYYKYALKRWKGNRRKAIMSYNVGFDLTSRKKAGTAYYKRVKKHIDEAAELVAKIENELLFEEFLNSFAALDLGDLK